MVRRSAWILLLMFLVTVPNSADGQKNCKKGKPCGNSCISKDKVCRVGTSSAPSQSSAQAAQGGMPAGMEFVASSRGTTYYWRGCNGWKGLAAANRIYFKTAEEAQTAGYLPSVQKGCAGPVSPLKTDSLPPRLSELAGNLFSCWG